MANKIEPMIYDPNLEPRILMKGSTGGFDWVIVARRDFPCAYVKIPEGHRIHGIHYTELWEGDCGVECHGDITWTGAFPDKKLVQTEDDAWWIGWDYGHAGDCLASFPLVWDKKWTTVEIMGHVNSVIKQLQDMQLKAEEE